MTPCEKKYVKENRSKHCLFGENSSVVGYAAKNERTTRVINEKPNLYLRLRKQRQ